MNPTKSLQAYLSVVQDAFRSLPPETQCSALYDLATDSLNAYGLHALSNELARYADEKQRMENL